jgi:hypothetical protein
MLAVASRATPRQGMTPLAVGRYCACGDTSDGPTPANNRADLVERVLGGANSQLTITPFLRTWPPGPGNLWGVCSGALSVASSVGGCTLREIKAQWKSPT